VFFGALRKPNAIAQGEFDEDSVNDHITKFVRADDQMATSMTIYAFFCKVRLVPDTSSQRCRLRLEEEQVRENAGFKEIWDRSIKIEELSRRRQGQRFGLVSSKFLME
jgi:hypothetical protein